jgi:hypothetical protein
MVLRVPGLVMRFIVWAQKSRVQGWGEGVQG